jgi:hypothetical protein
MSDASDDTIWKSPVITVSPILKARNKNKKTRQRKRDGDRGEK